MHPKAYYIFFPVALDFFESVFLHEKILIQLHTLDDSSLYQCCLRQMYNVCKCRFALVTFLIPFEKLVYILLNY